ncbi:Dabb family protein [Nocardia sp. AG03]|uniref:Dabb family protein n=1 Tax=Nocardia sp. AG03 TaxID=3025312 RepID=UPI00241883ED|nr:Dabb family protein [Nocardia sp. AG03]
MYEVIRLVHLAPGADENALIADLRASVGTARWALIQPTLPGVRNGGDILVHLRFADRAHWSATAARLATVLGDSAVTHVDGAEYTGGTAGFANPRTPATVHRVLLLRVAPDTPPATVRAFEADLLRMPAHIPTIRSWQLSTVHHALGSAPWTHVWEQEFTDLDGLTGPYLLHPIHWAHVDRWFDPEHPESIVRDRICHSFCPNASLPHP